MKMYVIAIFFLLLRRVRNFLTFQRKILFGRKLLNRNSKKLINERAPTPLCAKSRCLFVLYLTVYSLRKSLWVNVRPIFLDIFRFLEKISPKFKNLILMDKDRYGKLNCIAAITKFFYKKS